MSYPTILPMSAAVLEEVSHERVRQEAKWGQQNHPDGTGPLRRALTMTDINLDLRTGAELARIFRNKTERQFAANAGTYLDILLEEVFEATAEDDQQALRTELIQVAAVAVAWVEKIDRDAARSAEVPC